MTRATTSNGRNWRAVLLLAMVLSLAAGEVWAQGCAMCAASLPGAEDPLSTGFNYSIFIFLGVTYGLVIIGGGWIGYTYWRATTPRRSTRVLPFQPLRKEEQT
jgi:hypothetical protein